MDSKFLLAAHLHHNGVLRQRLLDLDAALYRITDTGYKQCLATIAVLRDLCKFFAYETQNRFQEEESRLYPFVENQQPQLRALLEELRHEHGVLRAVVGEFSQELAHCNATGNLRQLPGVGRKLVDLFRRHLSRDERELLPVILLNLSDNECRALDHLFAEIESKHV